MGSGRSTRLFPFSPHSINDDILKSILQFIYGRSYSFTLPELSVATWETLCSNPCERERLEFVGDALLSAGIAQEQMRIFPDGTPGMYTATRGVLTTNAMFAHLMARLGFHKSGDPIRLAADAFEAIVGAYHAQHGSASLQQWISQYFSPLIIAAEAGYRRHLASSKRSSTRYERDQAISRDGRKVRAISLAARLQSYQMNIVPPVKETSAFATASQHLVEPDKDAFFRAITRQTPSLAQTIPAKQNHQLPQPSGQATAPKARPIPIPIPFTQEISRQGPIPIPIPIPIPTTPPMGTMDNPIVVD